MSWLSSIFSPGGSNTRQTSESGTRYDPALWDQIFSQTGRPQTAEQIRADYGPATALGGYDTARALGVGQAPRPINPYNMGPTPLSAGATPRNVNAEIAQAATDRAGYQKSLYEGIFAPQRTELARQGDLGDRNLNSQLAATGLAGSGAGIGQRSALARETDQRIADASSVAANQSAARAMELAQTQEQFNAQQRQQGAQFNAGQALEAQRLEQQNNQFNAGQVLQGNIAGARNYIETMGLNVEQASAARRDFLTLMGLQEQDLTRLDARQQAIISSTLDAWFRQVSAMVSGSQFSTGSSISNTQGNGWASTAGIFGSIMGGAAQGTAMGGGGGA